MRLLGVAVIPAIVGVLLVSSGVVPAGTIAPAIGPAPAGDAKPVVVRARPEVQPSLFEDRDKDAALGLLLLLGMVESRHGR